jgi:hypothetical protein
VIAAEGLDGRRARLAHPGVNRELHQLAGLSFREPL